MTKITKEHINIKRQYETLQKRIELLKSQEEKIKKENINEKKKTETMNKIIQERKKEKENINKLLVERANKIKSKRIEIKEKYLEENKIFKSVNEEILKKNKKQYDTLKSEKEFLEKRKKERADEILEQNKIRVNAIKKVDESNKDKESINDKNNSIKSNKNEKETIDTILSPQQKKNFLQSYDLVEKYKTLVDELKKQEKMYLEKIEEAKKIPKERSSSTGKMKVLNQRPKNKDMKIRTKSSYKVNNLENKLNSNKKEKKK